MAAHCFIPGTPQSKKFADGRTHGFLHELTTVSILTILMVRMSACYAKLGRVTETRKDG